MPFGMVIAFLGQTFIQHPQATHDRISTLAFRFDMVNRLSYLVMPPSGDMSVLSVYRRKDFGSVMRSQGDGGYGAPDRGRQNHYHIGAHGVIKI